MVVGRQSQTNDAYALMKNPHNIRNLCIMAHVDHGKTSLADNLVASNGLISQRYAGRIRYMDSLKEEEERGITMKSSCVSLAYSKNEEKYLINLIDSPGHVDFSSEVSTAVRLCDGAIIVVDVIEGVCAQTKVVLQQAWVENIQPVLVLNKIDRLILERKFSSIDCYYHIAQVLEQVNAYMAELYNTAVLGKTAEEAEKRKRAERERKLSEQKTSESEATSEIQHIFADWGIELVDDSDLYFTPEQGNVVFASAYDGWGFSIAHFANQFSNKLGMNRDVLNKTLWGDYYISTKGGEKKILRGARDKRKNPLFVSLILENLYKVYDTVMNKKDNEELQKLATCLGVKLPIHVLKSSDLRSKLNWLCNNWLPLGPAVLEMAVNHLPSAASITKDRAMKLMCSATQRFDSLPVQTQALEKAFVNCSSEEDSPLIVYVSKIFGVPRRKLQEEQSGGRTFSALGAGSPISEEEMAKRREEARRMREAASETKERELSAEELAEYQRQHQEKLAEKKRAEEGRGKWLDEEVFVAFARVFSGTLKPGRKVYVLGPKHDPTKIISMLDDGELTEETLKDDMHIHIGQVKGIYLFLGRELEPLECATAGSVIGITGFEDHIIKSATLSSTPAMPPFTELTLSATPILRVAVLANVKDLPKLRAGLKLLNQADPCVQVSLQKSGEYVIVTAGEVHLQRCIDDLQKRYACVPVQVSDPIVPFRETIIEKPTVDRLNEAIEGENINTKVEDEDPRGRVEIKSSVGKLVCRAAPLPDSVTKLLDKHKDLLQLITKADIVVVSGSNKEVTNFVESNGDESISRVNELAEAREKCEKLSKVTLQAIRDLKVQLAKAFKDAGSEWDNAVDEIWSFGPEGCGPNILLNRVKAYQRPSIWDNTTSTDSPLAAFDRNFVTGFQLASAAGPLCEEPMMGVCFIIEEWCLPLRDSDSSSDQEDYQSYGISAGQIISLSKDTLRKAFEKQCQRLVCAMYSCVISVTSEVVGKMYNVIGKRQGRIVSGDITEGSTSWNITAYLPVIESMNFANDLRKSTSGEAIPQLVFSHWEILDVDPTWEPQTTEELTHWGDKSDSENIAKNYINTVRKRKGLATDEKIIESAEKQRTLTKNK